jgi:hypothetical protein
MEVSAGLPAPVVAIKSGRSMFQGNQPLSIPKGTSTLALKTLRRSHERRHKRCGEKIMSIRGYWGDATIDWDFDRFRDDNIRQMTKAAKKVPDVHQACSLLGHVGLQQ